MEDHLSSSTRSPLESTRASRSGRAWSRRQGASTSQRSRPSRTRSPCRRSRAARRGRARAARRRAAQHGQLPAPPDEAPRGRTDMAITHFAGPSGCCTGCRPADAIDQRHGQRPAHRVRQPAAARHDGRQITDTRPSRRRRRAPPVRRATGAQAAAADAMAAQEVPSFAGKRTLLTTVPNALRPWRTGPSASAGADADDGRASGAAATAGAAAQQRRRGGGGERCERRLLQPAGLPFWRSCPSAGPEAAARGTSSTRESPRPRVAHDRRARRSPPS